ncbi:MAG: metalloregulator ArsR/SmtB family transcription factor [Heliobacteriaceae bacterium]|nr:metalloregulator ArsR/SmtB family transcription factor [Heliobacteriaceae bacterium]
MKNNHEESVKVFKALADPNRLMIIEMLQNGEKCACQLLDDLHIVQSTLSYHMKTLCGSGVVNCRRDGKWMYYSLNKNGCETTYRLLTEIMESPNQNGIDEKCACE